MPDLFGASGGGLGKDWLNMVSGLCPVCRLSWWKHWAGSPIR